MQSLLIYLFLQTLYMFQAVPPPIIRSRELYIQLQVFSTNTAACLQQVAVLVPTVQEAGWAPGPVWTGVKSRPTGI